MSASPLSLPLARTALKLESLELLPSYSPSEHLARHALLQLPWNYLL